MDELKAPVVVVAKLEAELFDNLGEHLELIPLDCLLGGFGQLHPPVFDTCGHSWLVVTVQARDGRAILLDALVFLRRSAPPGLCYLRRFMLGARIWPGRGRLWLLHRLLCRELLDVPFRLLRSG